MALKDGERGPETVDRLDNMKIRKPKHSEMKKGNSLSLTAALQRSHLDLVVDQPKNNERKITFDIRWGGGVLNRSCALTCCALFVAAG